MTFKPGIDDAVAVLGVALIGAAGWALGWAVLPLAAGLLLVMVGMSRGSKG